MYNNNINLGNVLLALLLFTGVVMFMPNVSYAAGDDDFEVVAALCRVIGLITGAVGKTIASIIIITTACMSFAGKMTWSNVILVGAGISGLFGATVIVQKITGDSGEICAAYIA